jgi:hypothetical protein
MIRDRHKEINVKSILIALAIVIGTTTAYAVEYDWRSKIGDKGLVQISVASESAVVRLSEGSPMTQATIPVTYYMDFKTYTNTTLGLFNWFDPTPKGFTVNVIANSDYAFARLVANGTPQGAEYKSLVQEINGSCERQEFMVMSAAYHADRLGTGIVVLRTGKEDWLKPVPGSIMEIMMLKGCADYSKEAMKPLTLTEKIRLKKWVYSMALSQNETLTKIPGFPAFIQFMISL